MGYKIHQFRSWKLFLAERVNFQYGWNICVNNNLNFVILTFCHPSLVSQTFHIQPVLDIIHCPGQTDCHSQEIVFLVKWKSCRNVDEMSISLAKNWCSVCTGTIIERVDHISWLHLRLIVLVNTLYIYVLILWTQNTSKRTICNSFLVQLDLHWFCEQWHALFHSLEWKTV